MFKILVTGGAGYIGSILCERLLQEGYDVTVLDNLIYGKEHNLNHLCYNPNFRFIYGSADREGLEKNKFRKYDIIIPLAAIVGAPACEVNKDISEKINYDAIEFLSEGTTQNQLIIFPTTNSGYGTKSGDIYCTEETPLHPISLYGKQKVEAEDILLKQHKNSISLRLATVFGISSRMRIDLLVNHFVYTALKVGYIILFEKDFKRNYIHVRDVANCFIHCINNSDRMKGNSYNVGLDSANLSKFELANKIKECIPNFYIHEAKVGTDPDQRNYIVSNEKLRKTGFEAKISLDEGIKELIKGFRMKVRDEFTNC